MTYTSQDNPKNKLTLTEKSSKEISHKHHLVCGRDEDNSIERKTYHIERPNVSLERRQAAMPRLSAHHQGWSTLHFELVLLHCFQLVDHPLDHRQPALPECRIAGVEAERREQLGIMFGAAGREHGEIALGETRRGVLVDRVERIHQAIAERVGVNIERRMDEMRDVGPEGLVAGLELDRRAEAFALHRHP